MDSVKVVLMVLLHKAAWLVFGAVVKSAFVLVESMAWKMAVRLAAVVAEKTVVSLVSAMVVGSGSSEVESLVD